MDLSVEAPPNTWQQFKRDDVLDAVGTPSQTSWLQPAALPAHILRRGVLVVQEYVIITVTQNGAS
jgi:hypothetical protein